MDEDSLDIVWISKLIRGYQWRQFRKHIIKQRGRICQGCKTKIPNQEPLLLHHRDLNPFNNSEDNIILLCEECHTLAHGYRMD